ncbi:hypothetical protein QBC45DRAFT_452875 [Copromyces sp. CBS 386.78]|nr:hypothetical protein QBC45DRAFT_452875 [Copromyces sp. CBS 386.78]
MPKAPGLAWRYIILNDISGNETRIRLDRAICGTTYYTTANNSVVKFAWASGKRTVEVDYLTISGNKRKSSSSTTDTISGSNKNQKLIRKLSIQPPSLASNTNCIISEFWTIKQLLEIMRDAIKVYQSLYVMGKILHRNISPNNIIITDPETVYNFKSMLIDLDMAKFIAIEVLCNIDYIYRHNLESFFYETGDFNQIEGDMSGTFRRILEEFLEKLKVLEPLCWKIRDILFPYHEKGIIIATPAGHPNQLYRPIIAAYNEAISEL